ncbi:hypothetical protein [Actinomadura sp. WAC 06369]|uniref:hypothetical protein n=1 Tax=Actinomadura sp. WAC 06369 TaxID=2203193 RepID=UPI000F7B0DC5|nr:hypothetical protein [Actinomadura sp. WAC 06369]RSN55766.1 hypothetical protein DMH08_25620 [Actinomadura sp. WAC 06369]
MALVYVNQVLFTVYVLRVHGGDAAFVARYLPEGWFALADGPAMRAVAERVPGPELLAPSVLRVQAFLELPFVLLAYVTVLRWLDRGLYRRVAGSWLVWAASLSYTFVFCAVEWGLRNPYTTEDIAIRVCAAAVTPPLVRWLARRDGDGGPRVSSPARLLAFAASVWALGHLVLTVYDTALLYNLGHLGGRLPGAVAAAAVLAAARLAAGRLPGGEPGRAVASVRHALRYALVLFLVPALAVRYGPNLGSPPLAGAAGLLVCGAAAGLALRAALAGAGPRRTLLWCGQASAALAAGGLAGFAAVRAVTDVYYEAGLLRGAAVCFGTAVAVCAVTDRWLDGRPVGPAA